MPIDPRRRDERARGCRAVAWRGAACLRVGALCAAISCDHASAPDPRPAAPSTAIDAPQTAAVAEEAPRDPSPRDRAADLVALETIAAPDGPVRCAACSNDAALTLLVVASADDAAVHESLRDLDAMFRYYADDGLAGVLVLVSAESDRAIDRAAALRDRLRLAIDVRVPARVDAAARIAGGPLAVLVGRDGRVTSSATESPRERWSALDQAIVDALAGTKSPMP